MKRSKQSNTDLPNTITTFQPNMMHRLTTRSKILLALCITVLLLPPSCTARKLLPSPTTNSCSDNSSYRFNDAPSKDCKWVAEKATKRCDKKDSNLDSVRDQCPKSCNSCNTSNVVKRNIGQFCSVDSDCKSWSCQENTCFASPECKALKHQPGQEFDKDLLVIVFVGSGFTDLPSWRMSVAKTFYSFNEFEFFSYSNPRYIALYVDELDTDSYCNFQCEGVETLLCCDLSRMRSATKKCLPPGINVNTVVIENSKEYGGGGYRYANMATTSIHELGPKVAVHELGHSLFELGDEYTTTQFGDTAPNCATDGCPKWADLDEHVGGGLCSTKGCRNGDFFVPGVTFMQYLNEPFGEVNTRYTCCTFLALTGGTPTYCDRFEFGPGLLDYCKNDYQGYGQIYDIENNLGAFAEEAIPGKYVLVAEAAVLLLNMTDDSFFYDSDMEGEGPKLFIRRNRYGDYSSLDSVIKAGVSDVKQLKIEFDSGTERYLYFDQSERVDMPPNNGSESVSIDFIDVQLQLLEVVVDARDGIVIDIDFQDVEITWWLLIKVWIAERWEAFKNIFTKSDSQSSETFPSSTST
jgi:hypothetical protein